MRNELQLQYDDLPFFQTLDESAQDRVQHRTNQIADSLVAAYAKSVVYEAVDQIEITKNMEAPPAA